MKSRLKALGRLAAVYQIVEHVNGISLDKARASLHETQATIRDRQAAALRLSAASHEALRAGDLQEWLLDQSQIEFTQWDAETLELLRQRREAVMREAADVYQASRMQLEQLESVLDEVRAGVQLEAERAEQRASDDRYLSRQRWEERAGERRAELAGRRAAPVDAPDDVDD